MTSPMDSCTVNTNISQTEEILQCLGHQLEKTTQYNESMSAGLDMFFLIFGASLLFFMQAGFAMVCAGCVRQKNVQNTLLKNLLDACSSTVGFWSIGYALAYGGESTDGPATFVGNKNFFMVGVEDFDHWIFQYAFAATSATIVAGTLAERCQMTAYLSYAVLMTGFVYPVIAHAIWSENGFLSYKLNDPTLGTGMLDVAGSGVVHVTGGLTALIATKIIGARKDRFHQELDGIVLEKSKSTKIKGHSPVLQALGTFIMWFAWFGFNAGSVGSISTVEKGRAASLAVVNTALGGSTACISSLLVSTIHIERETGQLTYDLATSLNGLLAGLVSVTAGCAVIEPWVAVVVGFVAGVLYYSSAKLLDRCQIDDAVDAVPVHFFNGLWGCVVVGLFACPKYVERFNGSSEHAGLFYTGDPLLLGVNLVGLLFICAWVFFVMTPFFMIMSYFGLFRSDPLEEVVGLDISYHGVSRTRYMDSEKDTENTSNGGGDN